MPESSVRLARLETLADNTEARAVRAHAHATGAFELALLDAKHGEHEAAEIHRNEAIAHERAAVANAGTAARYRYRADRIRALRERRYGR